MFSLAKPLLMRSLTIAKPRYKKFTFFFKFWMGRNYWDKKHALFIYSILLRRNLLQHVTTQCKVVSSNKNHTFDVSMIVAKSA